jgi:hypothetical protein
MVSGLGAPWCVALMCAWGKGQMVSASIRRRKQSCLGFIVCNLRPVQDGREHRDYWISDGLYGGFNNIQVLCCAVL